MWIQVMHLYTWMINDSLTLWVLHAYKWFTTKEEKVTFSPIKRHQKWTMWLDYKCMMLAHWTSRLSGPNLLYESGTRVWYGVSKECMINNMCLLTWCVEPLGVSDIIVHICGRLKSKVKNLVVTPDSVSMGPYETHMSYFVWKDVLQTIQPGNEGTY